MLPIVLAILVFAAGASAGTKAFTDAGNTISFTYTAHRSLSMTDGTGVSPNDWSRGANVAGKVLAEATLFHAFEPATNFSSAIFSVGMSADPVAVATCLGMPSGNRAVRSAANIHGVAFTKFVYDDADAGHSNEIHSYRTVRSNRCYAIEYTIRSTNIGNYGPGSAIVSFNKAKVEDVFNIMIRSLTFRSSG